MIEDFELLEFQKKGIVEVESSMQQKSQNSMNLYDFISSLELGNLSHTRNIPDLYVQQVLKFLIHISRAFSHIHENGMIHGNFGPTKVICQKQNLMDETDVNYIMVNFEPWKVEKFMKDQGFDDNSIFKEVLKSEKAKLEKSDYIQILQIQDL